MKNLTMKLKKSTIIAGVILLGLCVISASSTLFDQTRLNLYDQQDQTNLIHPKASAYNTRLFLLSNPINQSHTVRGDYFKFTGYVQTFVIGPGWQNTSGLMVYPIIDGINLNGEGTTQNLTVISGNAGEVGLFEIEIHVNESYNYLNDMSVLANITEVPSENVYVNIDTVQSAPVLHDITTTTSITIQTDIDFPVMPNDAYWLSFNLTDSNGAGITTSNLQVFINGNETDIRPYIVTSTGGIGAIQITQEENMTSIGLKFLGMNQKTVDLDTYYEYDICNNITSIMRLENISATITITNAVNSTEINAYTNETVIINGNIKVNGNYIWASRGISLFINGTPIINTSTSASGDFTYNLNLFDVNITSNGSVTLEVYIANHDTTFVLGNQTFISSYVFNIIDQPPPPVEPETPIGTPTTQNWWAILIPIAVIAAIIIGIVFIQRRRMDIIRKRDLMMRAVDKSGKFAIITMLYNAGRKREAIAYTYKIFTDLINEKYSVQRTPAQTLREFAILMVTKYGLDPLRIYPYISLIENVIYGALPVNKETFEKAMIIFGRVFQEITGVMFNLLINTQETEMEQITIKINQNSPQP